jgi:hypothetical protein
MTKQEGISWISLLVGLTIGWYYFSRVLALPADADLFSPGMGRFALRLVLFSVFASVASEIALKVIQRRARALDATAVDERDQLIDLKACRNAYIVLVSGVSAVLFQVAMLEWFQRPGGSRNPPDTVLEVIGTGPLAPMHIAQLLLLALLLASLVVSATRIAYYRRDA